MAGDLTTYAGRARRRPPGASDFTQQIYRLLHEHPDGMTVEEIHKVMREGWMDTDAYRAYGRKLTAERDRKRSADHSPSGRQTVVARGRRLEFGTPEFKSAAQRWAIGQALTRMCAPKHRTARRDGIGETARYFTGERPPKVQGQKSTYVPFDPEGSRAVLTSTTTEHVNREQAKAELLALLNDGRVKGRTRDGIQRAYDSLCGRPPA